MARYMRKKEKSQNHIICILNVIVKKLKSLCILSP